jgi:mRNA-degrading endonuclease RelE of RelBE toxin-antitoxin system
MKVIVREDAAGELELLPAPIRDEFEAALDKLELAESLPVRGLDIIPLRGSRTLHRLAIGDYRGAFRYVENRTCDFLTFGPRAGFYQRFR